MALSGYHSWLKAVQRPTPGSKQESSQGPEDDEDVYFALEPAFSADRGVLYAERLDGPSVGQPISACRVACAPHGGLLACWPEPSPRTLQRFNPKAALVITSPGGKHRAEIPLKDISAKPGESMGRLMGVGWLAPEMLVCVFEHGSGRVFTATGQRESSFSVGQSSSATPLDVADVLFYSGGLVAVMQDPQGGPPRLLHLHWPHGLGGGQAPASSWLAPLPLLAEQNESATCYALVPPCKGSTSSSLQARPLQVVVGASGGGVAVVSSDDAQTMYFDWTPTRIVVDGLAGEHFFAVLTDTSEILILTSDLLREDCCRARCTLQDLFLAGTQDDFAEPPERLFVRHMAWVGCDGVAVVLDTEDCEYDGRELHLRVFDSSGRMFNADDGGVAVGGGGGQDVLALHAEVDACVVVGVESWSLLRAVPDTVVKAVGPTGDTSPASILIQAARLHDNSNSRCAGLLNDLRAGPASESPHGDSAAAGTSGRLPEAIRDCVHAAGWLWDIAQQRVLLRAALFGKVYCPQVDNGLISACAHQLRVLNTLHSATRVGRGLTHTQLQYLIMGGETHYVPDVLCGTYDFYLAREVSLGLELSEVPVLLAWARAKIMVLGSLGAESCLKALEEKLSQVPGVPWASVAASATELGYRDLGAKLLAKDPQDCHVVPLLIELDADEALCKALNTCSEDLAMLVLLCKFAESPEAFYRFLAGHAREGLTTAFDLWHSFALSHEVPMPDVKARWKSEVIGNHALLCSGAVVGCNAPAHAAVSALQEVLYSTAGPPQAGLPPGAQKGRGDDRGEWQAQQRLLDEARKQFESLSTQVKLREGGSAAPPAGSSRSARNAAPSSMVPTSADRGLYSLLDAKWQAAAALKFWQLRQRQFKYEQDLRLSLVGLSVDATLKKLLEKGHKEEFNSMVRTFLGPHEKEKKVFAMQVKLLASKKRFTDLLNMAEKERRDWHLKIIVNTCIQHGAHKLSQSSSSMEGGIMERLGVLASRISDPNDRQQLLDFLREKNVQVADVPNTMITNLQRVSGPVLNAAHDVANTISQAAQTGMGAAATSVMTGLQSMRKR